MKTEHQNIDEALIGLYLSGNANADEKQLVEAWINANDENYAEFIRFKKLWDTANIDEYTPSFNVDAAWNVVHKNINNKGKIIPFKRLVNKNLSWFSAAASVIVILSIGIFYFMKNEKLAEINFTAQNDFETFFLPDSSEVTLTKGSVISFSENFNLSERKTSLKGRALFKVRKNAEKPFIVYAGLAEIRVLGTEFVVFSSKDSCSAKVSSGKVQVNLMDDLTKKVLLTSGMQASISRNNSNIIVSENKYDVERYVFDKTLVFNQTPLIDVIEVLSKIFKVHIVLENKNLEGCPLTATFKDESLINMLEIISTTFNLTFTDKDATYILNGEAC